jgi:transposase
MRRHYAGWGRRSKDSGQARRLLALAEIYEGGSRSEAAWVGEVTLQSIRDWVLRFNSHGPAGLIAIKAPGPKPKLNDKQRRALKEIVEAGPIPAIHNDGGPAAQGDGLSQAHGAASPLRAERVCS